MSGKLRLNGATSGYSELQAPDVAGDQTFTLPAVGGELATKSGGGQVVGYQQGFWTPTAISPFTIEFNADRCAWSRIGNTVFLCGYISKISASTTGSGGLWINGIPYAVTHNGNYGSMMSQHLGIACNAVYFSAGSGAIQPYQSASGIWQSVRLTDIDDAGNKGQIYLSATYLTNDTTYVPINGATIS